jgi:hypothetical protein
MPSSVIIIWCSFKKINSNVSISYLEQTDEGQDSEDSATESCEDFSLFCDDD